MKNNRFTEKIGLFIGIVCANIMSANVVLVAVKDDWFYLIPTTLSAIFMFIGFWIYCSSNNE